MNLDALAKRYFTIVMLSLLATAAYFQASSVSDLLGGIIIKDGPPPASRRAHLRAAPIDPGDHETSAAAILARNPFDSVTGPLDAATIAQEEARHEAALADPYDAPACENARVKLIVTAESPEQSFAAIEPAKGEAVLSRRGAEIDGRIVEHIAWDRVWLRSGGELCQLEIGSEANRKAAKARATGKPEAPARPRRGALPEEIASRIQRVSETEFNVDRAAVDMILEQQASLLRTARITPIQKDGQVTGLQLNRIRSGTLLDTVGLKDGDTLRAINGFELTDPQRALEAYARLRSANRLSLAFERDGKPMTLDFNIR